MHTRKLKVNQAADQTSTIMSTEAVELPSECEVDVLVVGAGPAGLMASLCLQTFGLSVLHIDNRPHPTIAGRADGIQPRTLEVLRNIGRWRPLRTLPAAETPEDITPSGRGIAKNLIAQGVRVYEVSFWDPTETKPLARTSRARSCPDFIDVRDCYTLLLHQGLIEREFLAEISARAPGSKVVRPCHFVGCRKLEAGNQDHPVEATVRLANQLETKVRCKYLLGCDGAKSDVRKSLGSAVCLEGEGSDICWGVMDCWVESDFPDLKLKCLIHSRENGSIMVIPRENNLVRFYVQLKNGNSHFSRDSATLETCQEQAKKIFSPYKLSFKASDWFSVYQIGQRIANTYTLDGRIILGGDAVHTHSPKAGQGMNISMMDMYSLSWKINLIEKGIGKREEIIKTYEHERRGVALELIAFDSEYSSLFSGRKKEKLNFVNGNGQVNNELVNGDGKVKNELVNGHGANVPNEFGVDPQRFITLFKQNAYFTSGCGAVYHANVFNCLAEPKTIKDQPKYKITGPLGAGQRLLPGQVTRAIDGNPVRLEQEIKMDGAFRIYLFVGAVGAGKRLDHLSSPQCFLSRFRAPDRRGCSIFDAHRPGPNPFFTLLLVTSQPREEWEIEDLPPLFAGPFRSQVYVDDRLNQIAGSPTPKAFTTLHAKYGIEEGELGGGVVVVRPDGYVGLLAGLDDAGWKAVEKYFDGFLIEPSV